MSLVSTMRNLSDIAICRGGLAIGDTGEIPGGPTGLGWSKIPAHFHHQPALPLTSLTEFDNTARDLYSHSWCLFFEHFLKCLLKWVLTDFGRPA